MDTLNQVDAGCGVYDVADLARPENEGGIFKLLLHLTSTEKTEIALLPCTGAIRLRKSKLAQGNLPRLDSPLMIAQNFDGILLGPGNFCLFPAARPSAASMLDKQMATPDLFIVAVP